MSWSERWAALVAWACFWRRAPRQPKLGSIGLMGPYDPQGSLIWITAGNQWGESVRSLPMGLPSAFNRGVLLANPAPSGARPTFFAAYASDDWSAEPRLVKRFAAYHGANCFTLCRGTNGWS